jgi:hypothetical protein
MKSENSPRELIQTPKSLQNNVEEEKIQTEMYPKLDVSLQKNYNTQPDVKSKELSKEDVEEQNT